MKTLVLFFFALPFLLGAAAPPKPTPVIAGLGAHTDPTGRWYSSLARYSVIPPKKWSGSVVTDDTGASSDNFTLSSSRYIAMVVNPNTVHFSNAAFQLFVVTNLEQSGYEVKNIGSTVLKLPVATRVPMYYFSDTHGQYVAAFFASPKTMYLYALFTVVDSLKGDSKLYAKSLTTFRLDVGS